MWFEMSGGKTMQSSVSFTLPISCQICLGKVKEPVTCSNQHVFCSNCMDVWLERNSRCPTCRVEITSQSPIKKVIGGNLTSHPEPVECRVTQRELRRARHELVRKEYEEEIFALENEVDKLQSENNSLKSRLQDTGEQEHCSNSCLMDSGSTSMICARCENIKDLDTMLDMTKKLQEATKTYGKMKHQLSELKKNNDYLLKCNDDLKRENERIRLEVNTRSPMKYGRLTVATLEARLESAEKQVMQLQKALKRNDTYTEQLEAELKLLKSSQQEVTTQPKDNIAVKTETTITSQQNDTCNDILTRAFDSAIQFTSPYSKSTETYDNMCLGCFDETSKASSYAELVSFDNQFSQEFPGPTTFSETPPSDVRTTFSRKLRFDESNREFPHSSQDPQDMITSDDFFSIEDALGVEFASDVADSGTHSHSSTSANESTLNAVVMPPCGDDSQSSSQFNSQSSSSSAMKTTIDAGGSRITMSQLSAEEHDIFSRPNSAPSRTFLLSGSRFSALRPLDPPLDPNSSSSDFQPVKCISPMHMLSTPSKETEDKRPPTTSMLRLVNPIEVMKSKWRPVGDKTKTEDDVRIGRDALSRVNILKKKSFNSKAVATQVTVTSSPPMSDNRRKQKFQQKRSGEMSFQTLLKSPKLEHR